ncbi:bifunctional IPP transferase/Dimethylallyltransferase/P-loop containing nucleoside triphosphate hydrolase [Babesia duncani]|uniref:Bifunctional IPP transferase/Dimethylallyltransferase/P-loop containing nucleoside triphosphate hydrolase n=1 Tax=Babesia duncani TaxID=323732 RepID=A0AAD9PH73_9APIC|nr:bifunctional IPP transferase/Dimethylallyltransferase/P-loop containing nucleoside triphosphate hydrolase [Babesia duncani]
MILNRNIQTSNIDPESSRAKLIVIIGATATGKTKFGIEVCKVLKEKSIQAEIINGDAMQMYRGFDIGTAKPTEKQLKQVNHHLLGFLDPSEEYNASMFVNQCSNIVNELAGKGILPVIVGGTNLYIESLLWPSVVDLEAEPKRMTVFCNFISVDSDVETSRLYDMLKEKDPERAEQIHANDRKRILRALQVMDLYSVKHTDLAKKRNRDATIQGPKFDALIFCLECDPQVHRKRIGNRANEMTKEGLIDECKQILKIGDPQEHSFKRRIFQSIAYKEVIPILTRNGNVDLDAISQSTLDECATILETKTWQYARKQKAWIKNRFQRQESIKVHNIDTTGNKRKI